MSVRKAVEADKAIDSGDEQTQNEADIAFAKAHAVAREIAEVFRAIEHVREAGEIDYDASRHDIEVAEGNLTELKNHLASVKRAFRLLRK